jgi:hypothetical protein
MTFNNLISLVFIIGLGYMMFKGGGCCGSHGGHKKDEGEGEEKKGKPEIGPGTGKPENP